MVRPYFHDRRQKITGHKLTVHQQSRQSCMMLYNYFYSEKGCIKVTLTMFSGEGKVGLPVCPPLSFTIKYPSCWITMKFDAEICGLQVINLSLFNEHKQ